MAWVEVEKDEGLLVPIVGTIGLVFGGAVWWYHNFVTGFIAYLELAFALILVKEFRAQATLPFEARRAANVVLKWFRMRSPKVRIESVAVRAIEPDRYVIAVRHQLLGNDGELSIGYPTPRTYFAIARPGLVEITELPQSDWWPRGLK